MHFVVLACISGKRTPTPPPPDVKPVSLISGCHVYSLLLFQLLHLLSLHPSLPPVIPLSGLTLRDTVLPSKHVVYVSQTNTDAHEIISDAFQGLLSLDEIYKKKNKNK